MKDNIKIEKTTTFLCDELIADAIIKLNDKGYDTLYCCSGHADEIMPAPYIMFGYDASIGFSIIGLIHYLIVNLKMRTLIQLLKKYNNSNKKSRIKIKRG